MTDPTIRAALEAAARKWECTCHADEKCAMCVSYAAAAVAAFLRALPVWLPENGPRAPYWPDHLAAAVEEAARDG